MLPRDEYEQLKKLASEAVEDRGTARLVSRAREDIAQGDALLPKDVVDRLAAGHNPIRVLRDFREQTQAELAVRVGITQGYLSDLESGNRKGPLELHQKFARALDVPLDLLAPVAVSAELANPERMRKRKQKIGEMRRRRGQN